MTRTEPELHSIHVLPELDETDFHGLTDPLSGEGETVLPCPSCETPQTYRAACMECGCQV